MAAPIRQAARAVAALDALTGLADVAAKVATAHHHHRWPGRAASRHPVVEQAGGNRLHP